MSYEWQIDQGLNGKMTRPTWQNHATYPVERLEVPGEVTPVSMDPDEENTRASAPRDKPSSKSTRSTPAK